MMENIKESKSKSDKKKEYIWFWHTIPGKVYLYDSLL